MNSRSVLLQASIRWKKRHLALRQSNVLRSWLLTEESLTQRLRAQIGNRLGVNILLQAQGKPFNNECQLLQLNSGRYTLIREVVLHEAYQPLILARSIIPYTTIAGAQRNLSHLGTRPLGEVIFAYPDLQRLPVEITHIAPTAWRIATAQQFAITQTLWGRRTVYILAGQPLLVSEFFLPAALKY